MFLSSVPLSELRQALPCQQKEQHIPFISRSGLDFESVSGLGVGRFVQVSTVAHG
jgi:hypothetical protein